MSWWREDTWLWERGASRSLHRRGDTPRVCLFLPAWSRKKSHIGLREQALQEPWECHLLKRRHPLLSVASQNCPHGLTGVVLLPPSRCSPWGLVPCCYPCSNLVPAWAGRAPHGLLDAAGSCPALPLAPCSSVRGWGSSLLIPTWSRVRCCPGCPSPSQHPGAVQLQPEEPLAQEPRNSSAWAARPWRSRCQASSKPPGRLHEVGGWWWWWGSSHPLALALAVRMLPVLRDALWLEPWAGAVRVLSGCATACPGCWVSRCWCPVGWSCRSGLCCCLLALRDEKRMKRE